ncbi:septin-2 [Daktulosphaira vitifoliae]|uniref:septin-2 n=1 Tax=Daktulosphaira vitifoliae TaxID=58002 RepID=UPI0021AA2430|nr:septin-2 [Daktulosphaira vitifoliae]
MTEYVGFASLPDIVHRKTVKKGFEFTLMVVGESGLGKSTLINTLFLSDLYKDRKTSDYVPPQTAKVEKQTLCIEEQGVKLRLTVVDTPGFGSSLTSDECITTCCEYIDEQFRAYFSEESGVVRKNIVDNRVHCCLYFIPPHCHSLRPLDIEFMLSIHEKVNVIPVIGKADMLTEKEKARVKQKINDSIKENGIKVYQLPDCESDEDEDFKQQDKELKACLPFAVVGSNTILEVNGKKMRGRQYDWGLVEVDNPNHSDFGKLRNMLISTHMHDLKEVTEDVHYENYRTQLISKISQQAFKDRGKIKRDSVPKLPVALDETDILLFQKDEELRRMHDVLAQMQEKLKSNNEKSNHSLYLSAQKSLEKENKKMENVINV